MWGGTARWVEKVEIISKNELSEPRQFFPCLYSWIIELYHSKHTYVTYLKNNLNSFVHFVVYSS